MTWFNGVRMCVRMCEALGAIPQHHKPEQADLREVVLTLTRLLGPISLELKQQSQPQSGMMQLNGQSVSQDWMYNLHGSWAEGQLRMGSRSSHDASEFEELEPVRVRVWVTVSARG